MSNKKSLSQREIIRLAAEAGAQAALEAFEKERNKAVKGRYDRRLHNTKLLLRNYRTLKAHCENAIFERSKAVVDMWQTRKPEGIPIELADVVIRRLSEEGQDAGLWV